MFRQMIAACIGLAVACVGATLAMSAEHTTDSLQTVNEKVSRKEAVLVDVREKKEWECGHVEGAVLLSLSELRNGIDTDTLQKPLPRERIIYTHCAVGVRSLSAADLLRKHGYDVRPLKAGYAELLRGGLQKANK
jgi:phage shock protein E